MIYHAQLRMTTWVPKDQSKRINHSLAVAILSKELGDLRPVMVLSEYQAWVQLSASAKRKRRR